jgi:diguanylate cyclase (GGDEF)-like protein/PAS domain S-box-containing protein
MNASGRRGTSRPLLIALGLAAFAGIFAWRLAESDPREPISFLMVVPIGLLAAELGLRGGLLGAGIASSLVIAWDVLTDPHLSALGYSTRFIVFLASGVTVGLLTSSRRDLEEQSSRWFEQSLDLNCIANFEGRFIRVNRAFEQTLGYKSRDLTSTPYVDFVHPEDRDATQAATADILAGDEVADFENRYRAKNGDYLWLRWSASADPARHVIYASARDVTEQKVLEEQLKELAQNDPLTGLFNRRQFETEARRQVEYIRRYGPAAALFLFDIDKFKNINDSLGHGIGDDALTQVAAAMRSRVRATDICSRIGGDEFAILCPGVGRDDAQELAEALLTSIRESTVGSGGEVIRITSSLGIALFLPPFQINLEGLLESADRAMYVAKRAGGDRYAFDGQEADISLV